MTGTPTSGPAPDAPLTLRTFGGAGFFSAGTPPKLLLGPGKPLALLIYLALTPGRRISREFLMELLWGDVEPARGRNALRQALFGLRKLVGEQAIPGADELALVFPVDTDRDRFLRAVERGDLDVAVAEYTGPFLPDFAAPGGAAFERWADLERDRLQTAFLRCSELLVRRRLNEAKVKDAQRLARRVRDELPQSEAAWRLLLESIVVGRDFVAAAVEAEALESLAAADGMPLEPATRAAIARARRVTPAAQGEDAGTLVAELTGREREFAAITGAWESARAGDGRHLHLTAPAGLGKTRLLRDVVARIRGAGGKVVEVRGAPGDRDIPYAFAGDLAVAIAALPGAAGIAPASASTLIGLNPAMSSRVAGVADVAAGEESLRRRIQALADLVQAVADEQPFTLVIDDLHWVDPSSYRLLEGLFGRLIGSSVLCLTAARPERAPTGDTVSVLSLSPLSPAQVGSLITALGVIPDGPSWGRGFVDGMHAATRGSPLLVLETLRLALDDGILTLGDAGWRCHDETRLSSLLRAAEALRQRVRGLPGEQRWVLALLATFGSPLPIESLAAAVGKSVGEVAATLAALERHGLVTRTDAGWVPAHDEIADANRSTLDPSERQVAERAVGTMLVESVTADSQRLLRGIRHLAAAGDDPLVRRHFREYVRLARGRLDRRPLGQLASEALGEHADASRMGALVAAVPLAWRAGLWNRTRQLTAAAVAVALVGGAATVARARTARDVLLQRVVYADSTRVATLVPVNPAEWDGRNDAVVPLRGTSTLVGAALTFPEVPPFVSPDGRSAAWTQDSGDSTTLDIWIRTPAGTRRLTRQLRDDKVSAWLPDGSGLVGMTNRWTRPAEGNYDIAVFDTATGAARQITTAREHEGAAVPSPDGTRIAFVREYHDKGAELCVAAFDAIGDAECRAPGGHALTVLAGWTGLVELIISVDDHGTRPLMRYDWLRNELTRIMGPYVTLPLLSPDRRWVIAAVQGGGVRGLRDWIIPLDRPAQARRVERAKSGPSPIRWWEGKADRSLLIDRIEFTDSAATIQLGVGTRMSIRAVTAAGAEVPVQAPVRWTASDTLVASVDSGGDVRPRRTGFVTIDASLAGWRKVSRRLEVRGAAPVTALDERWDGAWRDRWITFGDPPPMVTEGPGGIRGFWNRGDGTFPNFAVMRRSFPARNGLGVEVRLSTPPGGDQWQRARTLLLPGVDTSALKAGDQRKAPVSAGIVEGACGATYPTADGPAGRTALGVTAGVSQAVALGRVADALASGRWWTLRVQILPDGRCGVAVNGRVVWLSSEAIPLDGEFRLRLGEQSADSKQLHGPLQVWTGVRTDIDWRRPPE